MKPLGRAGHALLILFLGATACTASRTTTPTPAHSTSASVIQAVGSSTPTPSPTPTLTPTPTPWIAKGTRGPEAVITLPDLGSVAWDCKGKSQTLFSTTFTAFTATERVGYSLDGTAFIYKRLQPGQT